MRIENIFHKISIIIVCCILSTITISGLFVQSTYNYSDYPFFEMISARKLIAIISVALLTSVYLYIGYRLKWNVITAVGIHLIINNKVFNVDKTKSFPVWSFIQMGINEDEFGFQDGTHSTEWTFGDCIDKYKNMGFLKVTKTLIKKELWMWTEGTYQAERYGFGGYDSTFAHENRITDSIKDVDNSKIRMIIDLIMKAQYYIYMALALAGVIITRKNSNYSLFNYCICGFACFYLVWEMKSRYIYSLYPLFIIFAVIGIEYIFNKILEKYK